MILATVLFAGTGFVLLFASVIMAITKTLTPESLVKRDVIVVASLLAGGIVFTVIGMAMTVITTMRG